MNRNLITQIINLLTTINVKQNGMKSGKKDVLYFLQEVDDQLIYHACFLGNMQESDKEKAYYMCISKLLKFINLYK